MASVDKGELESADAVELTGTLRSRLADRRRATAIAEITKVALTLFAERGFSEVTVDDIAAGAGISQRTFFRYFISKDDLLLQFQSHLDERLLAAFRARPSSEGPVTALRAAYVATSTVAEADRPRILTVGRLLRETAQLRGRAASIAPDEDRVIVELAKRMGLDPVTDPRPGIVFAASRAAAAFAWQRWIDEGGPGDAANYVDFALALLEDGLAAQNLRRRRPGTVR
ncbi:TetR family transcriptional regulator [Jatrophihabitans sp. DSM 45814]